MHHASLLCLMNLFHRGMIEQVHFERHFMRKNPLQAAGIQTKNILTDVLLSLKGFASPWLVNLPSLVVNTLKFHRPVTKTTHLISSNITESLNFQKSMSATASLTVLCQQDYRQEQVKK